MYWDIVATDGFIEQMAELPIGVQDKVHKQWKQVISHENPRDVGNTDACTKHSEYVVVVFSELPFKFVYKIVRTEHKIILIDCKRLNFLDYSQPDLL